MIKKMDKIPLIASVLGMILFLTLGSWQVKRLIWKQGLIADLHERVNIPSVRISTFASAASQEFTPLLLKGKFLEGDFFLLNRSMQGKAGINWLKIFADESGKNILVNRGWLPFELKDSSKPPSHAVNTLQGIARIARGQTLFMPDNIPQDNLWFYIDIGAIGKIANVMLEDYYLLAGENAGGYNYPVAYDWQIEIPNNHLQYAFTWFALALVTAVMGVIYQYRYMEDS